MKTPRATLSSATFLLSLARWVAGAPLTAALLVSSNGDGRVVRVDPASGVVLGDFVAAGAGGLSQPDGLVLGPDGNLYVCAESTSAVLRYDGSTGAFLGTFVPAHSGGLDICETLLFGRDGDLYVSSLRTNQVLRYDGTTGAFRGVFVAAGSGGLDTPSGMLFGPDGDLYVSSTSTHEVLRFDGTTGAPRGSFVTARSGGLEKPLGIAFGPDGDLYVSSLFTHQVLRYDGHTGAFRGVFVAARSGDLSGPYGLAFGADGNLYVASVSTHRVLRYRGSDGAFLGEVGVGGLVSPTYLTFTGADAPCLEEGTHLCLGAGRFEVTATWRLADGAHGPGRAVRQTDDSGLFWFFSPSNLELMVKVLDACSFNQRFWVFTGGTTDVGVTLEVTDRRTGASRTYDKPPGGLFRTIADTGAFATCP